MKDKLYIGKIVGTHGIKGEVKIQSISSFTSERFQKGKTVYLKNNQNEIVMEVNSFRMHKGMALVSFKNYLDINLVEKYRDYEVYGDYDPSLLKEGEYFITDLIGVEVYNQHNELLGKITGIREGTNYDMIEINHKVLVPYISAFVLEEDIPHKMVINEIDGLFEKE